jgi:hypothetical protein
MPSGPVRHSEDNSKSGLTAAGAKPYNPGDDTEPDRRQPDRRLHQLVLVVLAFYRRGVGFESPPLI